MCEVIIGPGFSFSVSWTEILKHEPEESTESTNTYLPVNEYVLFLHLLVVSRHVFQGLAWPSTILEVGYSET